VCPRSSLSFVYSLRPKIDATLGFEFCQKKKDATPLDVGPTEHALLKKKKRAAAGRDSSNFNVVEFHNFTSTLVWVPNPRIATILGRRYYFVISPCMQPLK
jgi:hypothetical protein